MRFGAAVMVTTLFGLATMTHTAFAGDDPVEIVVGKENDKRSILPGGGAQPGQSFRDCPECPEMVVVPAGEFQMGAAAGKTEASIKELEAKFESENPIHKVAIRKPFAVGKYSITFSEWDACVADGGCGGYKPLDHDSVRGDYPVTSVNWNDAKTYVAWISKKTGKDYRLLSEAEWEYVARAGVTTPTWGKAISAERPSYEYVFGADEIRSVKSFRANAWGLYWGLTYVHGKGMELCEDVWHSNYDKAPADESAWVMEGDQGSRVVRGGSWSDKLQTFRSEFRLGIPLELRPNNVSFRLARTLSLN